MSAPFGPLLDLAGSARRTGIEDLAGSGGIVVLAPHPDDESLGCGGAIAQACAAGRSVTIVFLTDGRRSHAGSVAYPPDRLAELRAREAAAAVRILTGTDAARWMGFADCEAPATPLHIGCAAKTLMAIAKGAAATALWTTWAGDPHCDHVSAARIARVVAAACPGLAWFSYPIWGRFQGHGAAALPAPADVLRLDTTGERDRKAAAVAAHRSQMTRLITDDPDGFMMPAELQEHFIAEPEIFIREHAP